LLSEFNEEEKRASVSRLSIKDIGLRVAAELDRAGENFGFFLT